jgi:Mlc titration factor MtfA (ptsG expression regulator)
METIFLVMVLMTIALLAIKYLFFRDKDISEEEEKITAQDVLRYESYLSHFPYYNRLSPYSKIKFMNRLIEFMLSKRWEGWEELVITEEIKVLVSASATQLTFGLEHYIFPHFHTIRIYPKAYYYKLTGQYFKGGTSESGTISLSWKHFVEGYKDPFDKLNLGLHEWAHALKIDLSSEDDFDSRFIHYLENWEEISLNEFRKMHAGEPSFLRSYAGTNMHEFFAVCVEHFFEVPVEFNTHLPDIYRHLCLLLNQDPSNSLEDYALSGKERHPKHTALKNVYAEPSLAAEQVKVIRAGFRKWPMYVVVAGLFGGSVIIYYIRQHTVISTPLVITYLVAFGTAGLFQWPYFKRRDMLELRHFVMYSFCGFGLCVCALMFMLNYLIPAGSPYEKTLEIKSIDLVSDKYKIKLADKDYDNVPGFSHLTVSEIEGYPDARFIRLTLNKGLLGMEVVRSVEFVK